MSRGFTNERVQISSKDCSSTTTLNSGCLTCAWLTGKLIEDRCVGERREPTMSTALMRRSNQTNSERRGRERQGKGGRKQTSAETPVRTGRTLQGCANLMNLSDWSTTSVGAFVKAEVLLVFWSGEFSCVITQLNAKEERHQQWS